MSIDPNIRPEVLTVAEIRDLCRPVLDRADVVLPSAGEAMMFTGASSDEAGCRALAEGGKLVVLKQGAQGCRIFERGSEIEVPGFTVEEVDPMGTGDAFCGGFTVALLDGLSVSEAGLCRRSGGTGCDKKGPMEGLPTR